MCIMKDLRRISIPGRRQYHDGRAKKKKIFCQFWLFRPRKQGSEELGKKKDTYNSKYFLL